MENNHHNIIKQTSLDSPTSQQFQLQNSNNCSSVPSTKQNNTEIQIQNQNQQPFLHWQPPSQQAPLFTSNGISSNGDKGGRKRSSPKNNLPYQEVQFHNVDPTIRKKRKIVKITKEDIEQLYNNHSVEEACQILGVPFEKLRVSFLQLFHLDLSMWPYTLNQRNRALRELSSKDVRRAFPIRNSIICKESNNSYSTPTRCAIHKADLSYILNPQNVTETSLSSQLLSHLESIFNRHI